MSHFLLCHQNKYFVIYCKFLNIIYIYKTVMLQKKIIDKSNNFLTFLMVFFFFILMKLILSPIFSATKIKKNGLLS